MSRWTIPTTCVTVLIWGLAVAQAADQDLPRNIELKPGAEAQTAADTSEDDAKTRQIVTEGKDVAPAAAEAKDAPPKEEAAPATQAVAPPPADAKPATPAEAAKAVAPAGPPDGAPPSKGEAVVAAPAEEGPPPGPDAVAVGPGDVVIAVQTELKRVGCDPGEIDGVWGGRSREALAAFGHFAKVDVGDLSPRPEILVVIKGKPGVICGIAADAGGPAGPPVDHGPPPPRHEGYGGGGYGGGGYGGGGY